MGRSGLGSQAQVGRARWRVHSDALFRIAALTPLLIFLAIFFAYPLAAVLQLAVSHAEISGTRLTLLFVGLRNFRRALNDGIFGVAIRNNIIFILGSTALTTFLGVTLALMSSRRERLARLLQRFLIWPSIVAPVSVSVIWWMLLSPQFGLLNDFLTSMRLPPQSWLGSSHTALAALIVVDTWHWTPICFILAFAGLQAIDGELREAAQVDGASERAISRYIVLPLMLPTIGAIVAIRILMGSKVFDELYLLTGGGPGHATTVVSLYIQNIFFTQGELGYGAALSMVIVLGLLCGWVVAITVRVAKRRVRQRSEARGRPTRLADPDVLTSPTSKSCAGANSSTRAGVGGR